MKSTALLDKPEVGCNIHFDLIKDKGAALASTVAQHKRYRSCFAKVDGSESSIPVKGKGHLQNSELK